MKYNAFFIIFKGILIDKSYVRHESPPLITMKMRLKMKNRSHRYHINRPRSSINLFRKAILWKKLIFQKINFRITYFFWRAVSLEQLLFQKTLPFIAAAFSEELLFYKILFQRSYYLTATVPFRSHTFYFIVSM